MQGFATDETYPLVQQIWRDCFGDNEEYTSFLFKRLLDPDHVLIWSDNEEKPVAILCFHPCELQTPSEKHDAVYVFGVATLPSRRNQGISTALLRELQKLALDRGIAASVLVPAGEKLFRFYANQGYETAFSVQKRIYTKEEVSDPPKKSCRLSPLTWDSWIAMRNRHYHNRSLFLRWNRHYLEYIESETRALGGGVFEIFHDDETEETSGFVVCYPYREKLIVKELAADAIHVDGVLAALHEMFDRQEYHLHLPCDMPPIRPEQGAPFAMIKWYDPNRKKTATMQSGFEAPYIAHVLDGPTLGAPLNVNPEQVCEKDRL